MEVETVNGTERTTFSVIDGEVEFGNSQGTRTLTNGQQAFAEPGQAPKLSTAGFIPNDVLQWCFYYPAVLDLADLPLTSEEQGILSESLAAYHEGDLVAALAKYPAAHEPGSDAERVYYAALLLSVGQVQRAKDTLTLLRDAEPTEHLPRLADALRQLIAAVKRQPSSSTMNPQLSTEFLSASYYAQSLATGDEALKAALALAKQAVASSPESSFAWARVAELEFSFGRTDRAGEALDMSLALALRNPQALTLRGFLVAAKNKIGEAIEWFDRAIAVDSSLGNAWLGRGLCRIRRGDLRGGREDLLVAAALEPQRAGLRSYLSKAYADSGDHHRAAKEMQLAKGLDPNDPTAWLYSALLNQERNRINEAIRDLERSQELNKNRSLYRSELLLDQDRAVRSANLAAIYRDAGMRDVSVREAARAVNYDYANYSGHLFLANSYSQLSDPNLINLRYETPANSEYLVANLLAPVGAGLLSPTISQQEYSKLFERDGFGVVSTTEYLSRGAWLESAAQFGTFGNFSYNFEAFYRSDEGQRPNNDVEQRQFSLLLKQQLTPQDTLYLQASDAKLSGGDLFQYYNQSNAAQDFRFEERQQPIVSLGYHHEWQPGVHTLFLAARLDDNFSFTNTTQPAILFRQPGADITAVDGLTMHEDYEGRLEIYSTELQQIWQQHPHTTIAGVRFQHGDFETENLQNQPSGPLAIVFANPAALQDITTPYKRLSLYAYHLWQVVEPLQLIGGITYDYMTFPENFRIAPLSEDEATVEKWSPKAGVIWTPNKNTTVRFAYTRALSGPSLDQSFQLEPAQVAGFIQSYRSIIPESVAGANVGAEFETFGLSLEQKFAGGTYVGLTGEILKSEVNRIVGAFQIPEIPAPPSALRNHLDYEERSVLFTLNQLLGIGWSIGARYRLSQAEYTDDFVDVPDGIVYRNFVPRRNEEALLHELSLDALYNHPCGLFGHFQALWYSQDNKRDAASLADDEFWQFNLVAGYRFPRRKAEITLGVLNLTDQDYRINPLTPYQELPRDRTFVVRLRINF
jgi:outer membrane receptor protein involved in Fe transport